MNINTYFDKIKLLLTDTDSFIKLLINKAIRNLIKNEKKRDRLIEHHSRIPQIYNVTETHESGFWGRPIISRLAALPTNWRKSEVKKLTYFLP